MFYILKDNDVKKRCVDFINELPPNTYEVLIVPIGEIKDKKKQRGLAHTWMQIIATETGEQLEEVKLRVKKALPFAYKTHDCRAQAALKYLLHVFYTHDGYVPSEGALNKFIAWINRVVLVMRSSEDYTKTEYSEFVTAIDYEASQAGVILPRIERE
jgi:hypothetical protein